MFVFIADTFVMLEEVPSSHKYIDSTCRPNNARQFASAVRKEITAFKSHLPNGVLIKGYENRMVGVNYLSTNKKVA